MKDSFVVITIGGSQHIVGLDDEIVVNRIDGKVGDTMTIDSVHLRQDDTKTEVGTPNLNYTVTGEIVDQSYGEKMHVRTYKAKSRYRRHKGHRQPQTKLKITKITKKRAAAPKSTSKAKSTAKKKAK